MRSVPGNNARFLRHNTCSFHLRVDAMRRRQDVFWMYQWAPTDMLVTTIAIAQLERHQPRPLANLNGYAADNTFRSMTSISAVVALSPHFVCWWTAWHQKVSNMSFLRKRWEMFESFFFLFILLMPLNGNRSVNIVGFLLNVPLLTPENKERAISSICKLWCFSDD